MPSFLLTRLAGTLPGHPVFLEATVHRPSAGAQRRDDPRQEYLTAFEAEPLRMICKQQRRLEFDFYGWTAGELIASTTFHDAVLAIGTTAHDWKPIRFTTTQGADIPGKSYGAIRLREPLDVVDPHRSVIETSKRYSFLKVTRHLALDASKLVDVDLFRIRDATLGAHFFVSDRLRAALVERGAVLGFVPEHEAAEAVLAANPQD